MAKKRIGILTGGGDVPGLNSVIKTVTYRSSENDIEVIGLRRGWEALTHVNLDDAESRRRYVMVLDRENTRTIDRRGGTVLHSSRTRRHLGRFQASAGESLGAGHRASYCHRR